MTHVEILYVNSLLSDNHSYLHHCKIKRIKKYLSFLPLKIIMIKILDPLRSYTFNLMNFVNVSYLARIYRTDFARRF